MCPLCDVYCLCSSPCASPVSVFVSPVPLLVLPHTWSVSPVPLLVPPHTCSFPLMCCYDGIFARYSPPPLSPVYWRREFAGFSLFEIMNFSLRSYSVLLCVYIAFIIVFAIFAGDWGLLFSFNGQFGIYFYY